MNGDDNDLLHGAVDCHVHSFPDVIARKQTDLEVVQAARANGMSALVLKSHFGCTCARAWLLNELQPDVRVLGGLVLNQQAGGLNPFAVETALTLGARQIWMPTKSAANHQKHLGGRNGLTILEGGRLRGEVIEIIKQIAAADVVLATGHLSPEESHVLIEEALALGVRRISVTHPEWGVTAMPMEEQKRLASSGRVFFERCLVSTQPDVPLRVDFDVIVSQIRAAGVATTIAATDFGMPQYAPPAEGLREFATRLRAAGFSAGEVRQMVRDNPRTLLGLNGT